MFVVDTINEQIHIGGLVGKLVVVVTTSNVVLSVLSRKGLETSKSGTSSDENIIPVQETELIFRKNVEVALKFLGIYDTWYTN